MWRSQLGVAGVFGLILLGYILGQIVLAAKVWRDFDTLGIGGSAYNEIILAKDLVADVLPPPEYLVETHLLVHETLGARSPEEREEFLKRISVLESEFIKRHDYWRDHLSNTELRNELLDDSYTPAARYFEIVHSSLEPALRSGNQAEAQRIVEGPLREAYKEHRHAIDRVVNTSNQWLDTTLSKAEQTKASEIRLMALYIVIITGAGMLSVYLISRRLVGRIERTVSALNTIANRDLRVTIPIDGEYEFQELGQAFNTTVGRIREDLSGYNEQSSVVDASAGALMSLSEQLKGTANSNLKRTQTLSQLTQGVSQHLHTISISTQDMMDTVRDISFSASEAANVTRKAVDNAHQANDIVSRLEQSSTEIDMVVRVIHAIAEQTNFLALNANIEASRAGEAGKGFAVVANEVKELANQTKKATQEIVRRIDAIRVDSRSTIEAITQISQVVDQVHLLQNAIVQAVAKQSDVSHAMAQNIHKAATSGDAITQATQAGLGDAQSLSNTAQATQAASEELTRLAATLRERVARWKTV